MPLVSTVEVLSAFSCGGGASDGSPGHGRGVTTSGRRVACGCEDDGSG